MTEYAISIHGYIWRGTTEEHDKLLSSMSGAKRLLKRFEDADKTYDVPNPPKRVIMCREVGPWKEARDANKASRRAESTS